MTAESEIYLNIEMEFAQQLEEVLVPQGLTLAQTIQIFIQEVANRGKLPDFFIESAKNEPKRPDPYDYLGQKRKFNHNNQIFIIDSIEAFFIAKDEDDAIMNIRMLPTNKKEVMKLTQILITSNKLIKT